MKTIYLHGAIGKKFGKKWTMCISDRNELIKAINANCEGFAEYIIQQALEGNEHYMLAKNPKELKSNQDCLDNLVKDDCLQEEIHIVPQVYGGFIASAIAFVTTLSATSAAVVAMSAAVWAGLSQLAISALTATDDSDKKTSRGDTSSTKSLMLASSRETASDGGSVPLGYGRMLIGPVLVSQSMQTFRDFIGKKDNNPNSNWLESSNQVSFTHVLSEGPIGDL